jgi:hypothetical protein
MKTLIFAYDIFKINVDKTMATEISRNPDTHVRMKVIDTTVKQRTN